MRRNPFSLVQQDYSQKIRLIQEAAKALLKQHPKEFGFSMAMIDGLDVEALATQAGHQDVLNVLRDLPVHLQQEFGASALRSSIIEQVAALREELSQAFKLWPRTQLRQDSRPDFAGQPDYVELLPDEENPVAKRAARQVFEDKKGQREADVRHKMSRKKQASGREHVSDIFDEQGDQSPMNLSATDLDMFKMPGSPAAARRPGWADAPREATNAVQLAVDAADATTAETFQPNSVM